MSLIKSSWEARWPLEIDLNNSLDLLATWG